MRNRPRTLAALLIAGGALCLPGTARTQSEIETSVTEDGKRRVERKVGPNEKCPCGSDKKYKKCCGKPGVTAGP